MAFVLVVPRRPPSANSRGGRARFQSYLRGEASAAMGASPMLTGPIYCRITWFHATATRQDLDNIAKGIIDAMKGVVFDDDVAIVRCLLTKSFAKPLIKFADDFKYSNEYNSVTGLLNAGEDDVLLIEVGEVGNMEIRTGAIEEEST